MRRAALVAILAVLAAVAWWRRSWVPTYATYRDYLEVPPRDPYVDGLR